MATTIDTSSPYISDYNVNTLGSNSVDKTSNTSVISKINNDPSGLTTTDGIKLHERALSQAIENSTSGIALSNIAQDGLNQQQNILNEIKQLTMQASDERINQPERELIAFEIEKKLQDFDTIAENTNYNGETLLKTEGDSTDDLSVVAEEKIISIYKAETPSISESLRVFLGEFPIKEDVRENMINVLDQNIDDLSSYASNFKNASDTLELMVKSQLTEVTNTATARAAVKNVDFGEEVSDFNKTQLLSQVGYLMQSQANAHTHRTIQILK